MNRQDLIHAVAQDTGLSKAEARRAVVSLFERLSQAVTDHREVRIAGLGSFATKLRRGRVMNGPIGNGERTADKMVPVFRPAKALKERVAR